MAFCQNKLNEEKTLEVQDIEKLNKDYDRAKSRFRELMAIKNHYRIKNNE